MEREIGRWNKATGIERGGVELWIGDVIECRVYIMDRHGGYIHVTGEVLWDTDYGQYCMRRGEHDWGELWSNTKLVWSYYNLKRFNPLAGFHFILCIFQHFKHSMGSQLYEV